MYSVIVPTRTASNLTACVAAVRECEPDLPESSIVVVDDDETGEVAAVCDAFGLTRVQGAKPFIFARNVNLGINITLITMVEGPFNVGKVHGGCKIALGLQSKGYFILNDDALLKTPRGISVLAEAAEKFPEYGLISATTNVAGNPQQFNRGVGLREAQRVVAFIAVYIPASTIYRVGLMDERFGGVDENGKTIYGFCDNDMCRRVINAGLKLGVHDGCFVDHGSLKSSFRGDPRKPADIEPARKLYMAKWGDCN